MALVLTLRTSPVRWLVSVTEAPGTTAPLASITVPEIVPVTLCPMVREVVKSTNSRTRYNTGEICLVLGIEGCLLREIGATPGEGLAVPSNLNSPISRARTNSPTGWEPLDGWRQYNKTTD